MLSECARVRQILEEAALHEQYTRVISMEPSLNEETEDVCALIKECADLRCASSRVLSPPCAGSSIGAP